MNELLSQYKGLDYGITDPIQKLNLGFIMDVMLPYFPETCVDHVVFHEESVRLCEATAQALYADLTPLDVQYERGLRPVLEKIVNDLTADSMTEREKMTALLRWVRDLPERERETDEKFGSGTEEEVIAKSSSYCGEQARVLARFCQIAGMQSRLIGHFSIFNIDGSILPLGHGVNEVYVDGAWAYVDIRGIVIEKPDGRLASCYDLMMFPEIIESQPEHVLREFRKGYSLERTRQRFLSPRNITVISNYLMRDAARYNYDKLQHDPSFLTRYREMTAAKEQEYRAKCLALMSGRG